ncbi:MAG: LPXTG cell wall anchor domain-containing protein, partial [Candidatus Bathyarchaeia archaeon]
SAYSIDPPQYATVYAVGIEAEAGPPEEEAPPAIPWEMILAIIGACAAVAIAGGAVLTLRRRRKRK